MGRRYVKKNLVRSWTQEDLEKAITAVKSGEMSQRVAGAHYNIPKSTIADYCSGRSAIGVPLGRAPAIPAKVKIYTSYHFT